MSPEYSLVFGRYFSASEDADGNVTITRMNGRQGLFYACSQKAFVLEKALEESLKYSGLHLANDYRVLKERIKALLRNIS